MSNRSISKEILKMSKSNPEKSLETDLRKSDSDGDEDNNWDEELLCAVRLKVGKSKKDPEGTKLSRIKDYLNEGANINVQDGNGDTVLHMAVRKGFRRIVEFLRQRGAQTDIYNHNGETAIGLAETLQEKDIVSILRKPVKQKNKPELSRTSAGANDFMSAVDEQQPSSSRGSDKATKHKPTAVEDDPKRVGPRKQLHPSQHADNAEKDPGSEKRKTYLAGATLTRSWPGIVYQLKHLAFTLHCALQQENAYFFLATEMVAAEKLDDVVLQYKNGSGKLVGRFVQIKYTSNQIKKISAKELLDACGDFSVPTYFASWRKLKKNELFSEIEVRNMILCTNMGLDVKDLAKNDICWEDTGDPDKSFELRRDQKLLRSRSSIEAETACYKLSADKKFNKKLYRELRMVSDLSRLAKLVAKCIYDKKPMRPKDRSFEDHHLALAKHVFDTKAKKFRDEFVDNRSLPEHVEKFRKIFLAELQSMARSSDIDSSEELPWKEIPTRFQKPEFLKGFGKAPEGAADILDTDHYLPDDYVDDVEISNFLEEFTLAVNQPNEDELNKILREKIDANSGFKLLNTELLDGAFQKKMLDWFVKNDEDKKEKEYFSYKVGEEFFRDMNNEVGSLITIGVNSLYCEQMNEYDVHFKSEMQRVKAFLTEDQSNSTENRILELVAPGDTLLTALRVYDILGRIQKYEKMDSFIFTRAESLKLPSVLDRIKNAFDSLRYPDLLIVDCESNGTDKNLQTVWNSLYKIIEENLHKKMIFITRTGGHETYREEDMDLGFRNLTNATQKKLLEKPVTKFQGHENKTTLGELLGICEFDNLSADELQDLSEIIDANALVEIIRSDQLELGADLDEKDTLQQCYINRTIRRDIFIKKSILEDKNISDLIAVSGTANAVLQGARPRIGENFSERRNFSTDLSPDIGNHRDSSGKSGKIGESQPMDNRPTNLTILDSPGTEKQFNDLCAEDPSRNIHWLQKEQKRYIWKKSQGDIACLVKHRDASDNDDCNDRTGATHLSEDQLVNHDEPVIISDTAGMGKSTMLTHLARKIKEQKPDMLVLKVDLNDHSTALSEVMKKESVNDLAKKAERAIQFLVKKLCSAETDLARKVFRRIIERKHKVALIVDGFDEISPTYEGAVIDLLQTFADYGIRRLLVATRPHTRATLETKLNTFSYVIQPLSKYDQERFFTEFWKAEFHTADDRIKKYTRALTNKLADSIEDRRNKFTGNPLQAQLVAEIFGNSCKEFIDSEVDEPQFPEKIDLIHLYESFVRKKCEVFFKRKYGSSVKPAVMEDERQRRESLIEKHERLALDTLFDKDEVTELLLASGKSAEQANPKIPVERDGIITQFIDGQPQFGHRTYAEYFAAKFFSGMLTLKKRRQTELLGKILVADILLGENLNTMRAFIDGLLPDELVLQGEFWTFCLKKYRSKGEGTIFHVAAAEGNGRILRLFMDCLYDNTEDQRDLMEVRDTIGRTIVHHAAYTSNIDIVKYLIQRGADINCRTNDSSTSLHLAAYGGKLDVVECLRRNGADINCQMKDGRTPLHLAAQEGKLDVVEYLHRNGADINCQDNNGWTSLHSAAKKGTLNVVEYLHRNGADIGCQENDGRTSLHSAAQEGKLNVVEYLHRKGADINCQRKDGWTSLHLAAYGGKLDVVEYLHRNGADINCQRKDGWTSLHLAAYGGKLDVVEYLHRNGAVINCQSKDGWTSLHLAAQAGRPDVVEYLHRNGAVINC